MEMKTHIKLAAVAALGLAGCLGEAQTIDRTQPNALDKSNFEGIWYYRSAVVESDLDSGVVEGITSNMEKLRWEITQNLLIGYRSYEFVPYAEGLTDDGRDFFGSPVVAYAIESHFDIQREYNPTTGVESNVIVENTTDRPWYQRRFMRVDWRQNIVGTPTAFRTGWVAYPDAWFSGTAVVGNFVQGHEPTETDRPYITEDYMDITNQYAVSPSASFCYMTLLFNSVPRCGAGQVRVRLSFRKVDPNDDFESLYYPDVAELRDDSGNAIVLNGDGRSCGPNRDPGECNVRTFPMDEQYGNFRVLRVAFDRERAFTRTGRIYLAGRFDLWKDSYDEAGSLIPYASRDPQPVVYYNNVEALDEMYPFTQQMADDWSTPFDETVAFLKGYLDAEGRPDIGRLRAELDAAGEGPQMFQIRENDCNVDNIVEYAQNNDLMDVVNSVAGSRDRVTRGNLEQVCAAVQFRELEMGKTIDPKVAARTGAEMAFTWQRKGDLRYNINNYINQVQGGPWGVAQFGQDPETGEFVANQANYFANAGDIISQRSVDQLQWLNGDLSEEELFRGDFTRDTVVSRRGLQNRSVRSVVKERFSGSIDAIDGNIPREGNVGGEDERFARMWGGSDVERDFLMTDDILRTFAGPTLYQPFDVGNALPANAGGAIGLQPGEITDEAMEAASPVNWGMTPETNVYNKAALELGRSAWDMADFFDPNISGLAEFMKGRDRDEVWNYMRHNLYLAVQTHEIGHTVGLRHNFQASMDALNYRPEFWGATDASGTRVEYWNNPPTKDNPNRGNEYKYASIMDYGFDIAIEGWHGLGTYDAAAVRFQHGQIMEIWDPAKVSIPDPRKYGSFARRCGHDSAFFGFEGLMFWNTPEALPKILSSTPKATGEYRNGSGELVTVDCTTVTDFDSADAVACDSDIERRYRNLIVAMESNAVNQPDNACTVFIADINNLLAEVDDFPVRPDRIYGARKFVQVADYVEQQIEILTNFPEYDTSATNGDESTNGEDDDGDGVADDKGFDWTQAMHPVQYEYCSDLYANFSNPFCQRWDTGWDFTEQVRSHIDKFDRDYVFSNFRRDALSPWGNPRSYMARLMARRFFHMSNVYRYYLFTRQSAFRAPRYEDWEEAMYEGINFLERVIQAPEPGTYCLGTDNVYRIQQDPDQVCEQAYTVGLGAGQGRYYDNSWTEEYFYKANRIGDYYTKLAAIQQLTSSSGRFVRDLSDLFDRRAFSLGYLRVFNDPLLQRFSALVSGDHNGYRSRVVSDETGETFVRYMPFFDENRADGGSVRQWLEEDLDRDGTEDHPEIEPAWTWSLQYYSLAWALANWSSVNDYAPEYYRMAKISIQGTPEDVDYPDSVTVQTFTDPETSITYRAPVIEPLAEGGILNQEFPAYYGDARSVRQGKFRNWSAGSNILAEAESFVNNEYTPAKQACQTSGDANACDRFRRARAGLNERIGYIDRVRKFNRRAELSFEL